MIVSKFTKFSFFYFSKRDLFHQKPSTNEIDQSAFGLDSFFDWIIIGIWVWNIYKKLYDSTALVWQPVGDRKNRSIKRQFLDIVRCPVKLRTARFFPGCDTITVVKLVLVLVTVVRTVGHWSIMKCIVLYWKTMKWIIIFMLKDYEVHTCSFILMENEVHCFVLNLIKSIDMY